VTKDVAGKAKLDALGGGRFRVSGVLDASTAGEVLRQSEERFGETGPLHVDLGGVGDSDSAGLALLIEWVRCARKRQRDIRFENVPAQINALAKISEVEDLLVSAPGSHPASATPPAAPPR
jgi:phospholipid transport system transporter-binding protein